MYSQLSKSPAKINFDIDKEDQTLVNKKVEIKEDIGPARENRTYDVQTFIRHRLIKLLGFTPRCLSVPHEKNLRFKFRCWSFIELVQHMFLFFFAGYFIAVIMNASNRGLFDYDEDKKQLVIGDYSSTALLFILLTELIVVTILIYYIRKMVLLIPPLPMLWDEHFIPLLTVDLSVWAVFVIIILELSSTLSEIFAGASQNV